MNYETDSLNCYSFSRRCTNCVSSNITTPGFVVISEYLDACFLMSVDVSFDKFPAEEFLHPKSIISEIAQVFVIVQNTLER